MFSPSEVELATTWTTDPYLTDMDYDTLLSVLHTMRSALKDRDNTMIFDSSPVSLEDIED